MNYISFTLRLYGSHLTQDERYAIWKAAQKFKSGARVEVREDRLEPIFEMVEHGKGAREILRRIEEEMK